MIIHMPQCSRHTAQCCIFILGYSYDPRYLKMSCGEFFFVEGGEWRQGDAQRWWQGFGLLTICIFLWSFHTLCHGCCCFFSCCYFSCHDYCNYIPALISQLASCQQKDYGITWNHSRIKRIPSFAKFLNLLCNSKLHLSLEFWWSDKYKTRSKKLAKYFFRHRGNPQTFRQEYCVFLDGD